VEGKAKVGWLVMLALAGGFAVTLQAQFMGVMTDRIGTAESIFITYGTGGVAIGLVILAMRGGNLGAWSSVPWYVLTAGLLGLVIVGAIGYTVPRLGLVAALSLFILAQFALAALVDHFGWLGAEVRPLDLTRAVGLAAVLIGSWLVLR
jgi:bacterial/archaeal transporter family-2 protein